MTVSADDAWGTVKPKHAANGACSQTNRQQCYFLHAPTIQMFGSTINKHRAVLWAPPCFSFENQSVNFALNYSWKLCVAKPKSQRQNRDGEERGKRKRCRDEDEEDVWLTVLLLFSKKAEEHEAPQVRRLSCWDLDPTITRLEFPLGDLLTLHHNTSD